MQIKNSKELGQIIKQQRKGLKLTQVDCAGVAGVGVRFLSDLESGKLTCEIGKTMKILAVLGIHWHVDGINEAT